LQYWGFSSEMLIQIFVYPRRCSDLVLSLVEGRNRSELAEWRRWASWFNVVCSYLTDGAGVLGIFQRNVDPNHGLSSNLLNPRSFPNLCPSFPRYQLWST